MGWALGVPAPSEGALGPVLKATDVTLQLGRLRPAVDTQGRAEPGKGVQGSVALKGLPGASSVLERALT